MLRAFPLLLACLFWSLGSQVEAADTHPASQARAASTLSQQDLEAITAMANQGDAGSQNYLGFLYATGQIVAKDEKAAFGWFQKAADQGYPEALGNLAMMYEKGLGITKNLRTAFTLHRQAAMAGYPISMKRLANLYETGFMGEERDPIKAEMWKTRYKETLKTSVPAPNDASPRQAAERTPVTAQAEKSATLKPAAPATNTPPQAATAPVPGDTRSKPISPPTSNGASGEATPYYIQIGGKATATSREAMEVTQKIVEKNLLPQNKKIELVNPDGKSYRINIGPFADAHQAAPYKAKIMALLNAASPPDPAPRATLPEAMRTAPAAVVAATPSPAQATPSHTAAAPPKTPVAPAMAMPSQGPGIQPVPTATRAAEKPIAAVPTDKSATKASTPAVMATTPAPVVATPVGTPSKLVTTAKTEAGDKGKSHYVEISGQATAQEATELIQNIVKKGMLPKNMQVELVNFDADNYRIRIGPFADAGDAAPQLAKINASIKSNSAPSNNPMDTNQELIPVASSRKSPLPAANATAPQIVPALPVATPKAAVVPVASLAPAKPVEEKLPPAKIVRGRYYFLQINANSTFDDSMLLTQSLFNKDLVQQTRRVRIENLDGRNFRVRVGPFSDAREAHRQLREINQQTSQALSVVTLEKLATATGQSEHQPFIQVNAKGTLDHALTLTRKLMEKNLVTPTMFVEIVNFGAGNYRARFGPFSGTKEAGQNIQNLRSQLKVSPVLVNLERLLTAEGR